MHKYILASGQSGVRDILPNWGSYQLITYLVCQLRLYLDQYPLHLRRGLFLIFLTLGLNYTSINYLATTWRLGSVLELIPFPLLSGWNRLWRSRCLANGAWILRTFTLVLDKTVIFLCPLARTWIFLNPLRENATSCSHIWHEYLKNMLLDLCFTSLGIAASCGRPMQRVVRVVHVFC